MYCALTTDVLWKQQTTCRINYYWIGCITNLCLYNTYLTIDIHTRGTVQPWHNTAILLIHRRKRNGTAQSSGRGTPHAPAPVSTSGPLRMRNGALLLPGVVRSGRLSQGGQDSRRRVKEGHRGRPRQARPAPPHHPPPYSPGVRHPRLPESPRSRDGPGVLSRIGKHMDPVSGAAGYR